MHRVLPLLAALAVLALLPGSAGAKVAAIPGDVNGDRLADVLITDTYGGVDADNQATLIFGSRQRAGVPNYDQPGPRGLRVSGGGGIDYAEIAGDTNGDGLADLFVNSSDGGPSIVFGRASTAPVDLGALGADGLDLRGMGGDPTQVVGDINGDGLGDLADAPQDKRRFLRVWLGGRTNPFSGNFEVVGTGRITVEFARVFAVAAGDVNGDGIGDMAFPFADPDGRNNGAEEEELVYVVYGSRSTKRIVISQRRRGGPITVTRGGRPAGRVIRHDRSCICSIWSVAPLGDLNGDGRGELGILLKDFRNGAGGIQIRPSDLEGDSRLDIAYGSSAHRTAVIPRTGGVTVTGTEWTDAPVALGDVTGDGRDDLLVAGKNGSTYGLLRGGRLAKVTAARKLKTIITGATDLDEPGNVGDVDGDRRSDVRFARLSTEGNASWGVLFGARPLPPFSLRSPTPGVMPMTYP